MTIAIRFLFAAAVSAAALAQADTGAEEMSPEPVEGWRSRYYPEDWEPGYSDEEGRFLHDFSYAGYHMGEKPLPENPSGPVVDVTKPPYNADPSGERDSTPAIQAALDDMGEGGGGTVYLPEGTYRVGPPEEDARKGEGAKVLSIQHSGVVLRGDGPGKTHIFNANPQMRFTPVILVRPPEITGGPQSANWLNPLPDTEVVPIVGTVEVTATEIPLEDVGGVEVGEWVMLSDGDFLFYRQVTEISEEERTITIDIPIRRSLSDARMYRVESHLEEVGIEELSIGMQETDSAANARYSFLIMISHVVNGWVRRVHSYRPPSNEGPHHMLGHGIRIWEARNVTISECDLREAQYGTGGGSGYGYTLMGSDNLIQDCVGENTRYVYDFQTQRATGNVIHRSVDLGGTWGFGSSDFHQHWSVANLIDNLEMLNGAWFNAGFRHRGHGTTTDQSVLWNMRGMGGRGRLIRVSRQSGRTFIIGTRGERTGVRGLDPEHRGIYFEGEGQGDKLRPESLYEDQLRRRTGNP